DLELAKILVRPSSIFLNDLDKEQPFSEKRKDPEGIRGISNFTGRIKGMHISVGNFTYVLDFMIVEDISSIIDPRLSQVVLGKPFVEVSNMTYDLSLGVLKFTNGTNEIAYKMPDKIEQYNSLSDLEKEHMKSIYFRNEEDKRRGVKYVMNKILRVKRVEKPPVTQPLDLCYILFEPSQPIPSENDNNPRVFLTTLQRLGYENPIRTLGDYSRPSHKGYQNTIELPDGNNVVDADVVNERINVTNTLGAYFATTNFHGALGWNSHGYENPIRTLGDYSRPSHKGYRNTIELPDGNNVVDADVVNERINVTNTLGAYFAATNFCGALGWNSYGHSKTAQRSRLIAQL
nr:polyneuridine-aldehyde esterase [Tanacetum cinerariifolium]